MLNIKYFKFIANNLTKIIVQYMLWFIYDLNKKGYSQRKIPATASQTKFYKHSIVNQLASSSRITTYYYYRGDLNIDKFNESVVYCASKHDIFKTRFSLENGELRQIIEKSVDLSVDVYDLTKSYSHRALDDLLLNLASIEITANQLPLMKISIIQLPDNYFKLVFVSHHMILDGWSLYNFQQQVSSVYNQLMHDRSPQLSIKSIQFKDYVWVEKLAIKKYSRSRVRYWKEKLKNIGCYQLPFLKTNRPVRYSAGNQHKMFTDYEIEHMEKLKKSKKSSTFQIILSVTFMLLYKYTKSESITILIPRFARFHPNQQSIIGPMLDSIPLTIHISHHDSLSSILEKVGQESRDIFSYDDIPFDYILDELAGERDIDLSQLSKLVTFNYISGEWRKVFKLDGCSFIRENFIPVSVANILNFYVVGQKYNDEICLDSQLTYQDELIESDMAEIILEQLHQMLRDALLNPAMNILNLTLLDESIHFDKSDLNVNLDRKIERYLPELMLNTMLEHSDRVAIERGPEQTTYRELLELVGRYYYQLESIKQSCNLVILGKKNKSWYALIVTMMLCRVPIILLDEYDASDVLEYKLTKIENPLVITSSDLHEDFLNLMRKKEISVIEVNDLIGKKIPTSDTLLKASRNIEPYNTAYIMFTSGSTGQPKLINGNYSGLTNFICWQKNKFNITTTDKCAQIIHVNFDVILREILTPLLSGATLVIHPSSIYNDSANFFAWLRETKVTFFHVVPSVFSMLLQSNAEISASLVNSLRYIFFAGEPLYKNILDKLYDTFYDPGVAINLYGPSETTLATMYYVVPKNLNDRIVPIGKNIPGSQTMIVHNNSLCGIGEVGEIVIRSSYKTNLSTNDSRLKKLPFCDDLVYFTGDLGFINCHGDIEIIGRNDNEVKIGGVKVNLGYIEKSLNSLAYVRETAVLFQSEEDIEYGVVAYVVLNKDLTGDATLLIRNDLKATLPKNHLPKKIIIADALARLPSGKIDKVTLRENHDESSNEKPHTAQFQEKLTKTESLITSEIKKIIEIDVVSPTEDLTMYGLSSLQKIQLLIHLQKHTDTNITLFDIEKHSSIRHLAKFIESNDSDMDENPLRSMTCAEIITRVPTLDISIMPEAKNNNSLRNILLTGATGFLGAYLLQEIQRANPDANIYCLVRCCHENEGLSRIKKAQLAFNPNSTVDLSHIKIIPGDLSKVNFGVSNKQIGELQVTIDAIAHCAAHVDFLKDFDALYDANILGTKNIIEFASSHNMPVHYVSTAGIFPGRKIWTNQAIEEDYEIIFDDQTPIMGGYAQTKWAAEYLVKQAIDGGLTVSIYRFGRISGSTQNGVWPESDFIFAFMRDMVETKMAPKLPIKIELTPVDIGAKMFAHVMCNNLNKSSVYHIVNHHQVDFLEIKALYKQIKLDLEILPYEEWRQNLLNKIVAGDPSPLARFAPLFPKSTDDMPRLKYNRLFSNKNLMRALEDTGLDFYPLHSVLLHHYLTTNQIIGDKNSLDN